MKPNIVFLEGLKKFSLSEKKNIQSNIDTVATDVFRYFKVKKPVVFSVYKHGRFVDGYTAALDLVRVTIPVKKWTDKELAAVIYHELNHIVRGYSESENVKNKITLLDAVVAEGLATAFEMEMVSGIPCSHGQYSIAELKKQFKHLKTNLDNNKYSHAEWFSGANGIPNQFGYKMGKYIIDEAFRNNPKFSHRDLIRMPTKKIWKLSRIKI